MHLHAGCSPSTLYGCKSASTVLHSRTEITRQMEPDSSAQLCPSYLDTISLLELQQQCGVELRVYGGQSSAPEPLRDMSYALFTNSPEISNKAKTDVHSCIALLSVPVPKQVIKLICCSRWWKRNKEGLLFVHFMAQSLTKTISLLFSCCYCCLGFFSVTGGHTSNSC